MIDKINHRFYMCIAFFLGIISTIFFNVNASSSMSGSMATLDKKGTVEVIDAKVIFHFSSQEHTLEELDYLSLARLSDHYGSVMIISE
jgi:hypothetical protein